MTKCAVAVWFSQVTNAKAKHRWVTKWCSNDGSSDGVGSHCIVKEKMSEVKRGVGKVWYCGGVARNRLGMQRN